MIIYTYPVRTAFTERDVEMIEPHFSIKPLKFTDSPVKLPFYFILQAFQLLFYLPKTSHYLCFFAGYHSYLPVIFGKLFKKKVFIQCGGTDAMNMPAINYGNYRKNILRQFTEYSFRNCTMILPVAEALVQQEYNYSPIIPKAQGLKNLAPGLKTPIRIIHNGFSGEFWKDLGLERKSQTFITVATGISKTNRAMIKGIDLIEEMADRFPKAHFTIVGDAEFKTDLPNIKVFGKLPQKELLNLFNQHRFYLQLSMSEGFPNALAEAMLCGCIPIGSAVGAIPEIIGDTGFFLEKKDPAALVRLFHEANAADFLTLRILAPLRIKTHYDYEDRKNALLQVFQ